MARLSTETNQIALDDCEIRATLLPESSADQWDNQLPTAMMSGSQLVLNCPACSFETILGDRFCQECGVLQPAFEEQQTNAAERFTRFVSANPQLSLVILAATLGAVLVLFACAAVVQLPGDLEKSLAANKLNDATKLAEKLLLSRFGKLTGKDAELYSEAFYKRGLVFAGNQNYKYALADLAKVLPTYSKASMVSQLMITCKIAMSQASAVVSPHSIPVKGDAQATSAQTLRPGSAGPGQASSVEKVQAPAANAIKGVAKDSQSQSGQNVQLASKQATRSMLAAPKRASTTESDSTPETDSTLRADTSNSTKLDKDEVNSDTEEADMAAYNRHLADYFVHRETKGAAAKDPPSFSEWVQSGKKVF